MVSALSLSHCWGRLDGAGGDFAKAQKEVITIDQSIIFTGFYEKIRR